MRIGSSPPVSVHDAIGDPGNARDGSKSHAGVLSSGTPEKIEEQCLNVMYRKLHISEWKVFAYVPSYFANVKSAPFTTVPLNKCTSFNIIIFCSTYILVLHTF